MCVLFRNAILDKIASGKVTTAFRYWRRPTVKAGGRLRTPVGELAIETVERCAPEDISERDARAAGFEGKAHLLRELERRDDSSLYRITFHLRGADPRVALREQAHLSAGELAGVTTKLARLDRAAGDHPWTQRLLQAIAEQPAVRAGDVAAALGVDKDVLKRHVRKLKELGLTESLAQGYRLSPRGQAVLATFGRRKAATS